VENLTLQFDLEVEALEPDAVCVECGAPCTDMDIIGGPGSSPVYRCQNCVVRCAASMMG